ncbi:MAG: exonuclease domain-containing protein [Pusillimonas sp.]
MAFSSRPRLKILRLFASLCTGCLLALAGGLYYGYHKANDPDILNALVIGGVLAGFAIFALTAWAWLVIDEHVAQPALRLAGKLRTLSHAHLSSLPAPEPSPYLSDLLPAAHEVARQLLETRTALEQAVTRQTEQLSLEKDRLEHLLSDVPVGLMLCSAEHQVVFYNGQIISLLGGLETGVAPGLNRRVFDYLHAAPIQHAYTRLLETDDPDAASDILCSTLAEGRVLAARMRLLTKAPTTANSDLEAPGYVLTLRDVTGDLATHSIRPDTDRPGDWPLSMIRASDLASTLQATLRSKGVALAVKSSELILRCDGFQLVALVTAFINRLPLPHGGMHLDIAPQGSGAMLELAWEGRTLTDEEFARLHDIPLDVGLTDMTVQGVLSIHGAHLEQDTANPLRPALRLTIREARVAQRRPPTIPRSVVYDFKLLSKAGNAEVSCTPLDELTYVVFDTETTGLYPDQGDDIVQIAAVRIINGKRVNTEVFDTLVNPGRSIPASSTRVHGITNDMVRDAPEAASAIQRFHKFAEGAVLVAHNAPFDMAFIKKHEAAAQCAFDHPILDTVLLSAVLYGEAESHSLDALAHRLGITIPEEARHTAIGDAVATADALLKIIPALKARQLDTFGAVLSEVRQHRQLLKDLNT